jgi:hypothetical protein
VKTYKNEQDHKMKYITFAISAAATFFSLNVTQSAFAIPLVYQCKIFDYLDTGVEVTEFQYHQIGKSFAKDSAHSTARIYLSPEKTLYLSIRPKAGGAGTAVYSSVTGYSLPHRLDVVLSHGFIEPAYAANLSCDL